AYFPLYQNEGNQKDDGKTNRDGVILWSRSVGWRWSKIGSLLCQTKTQAGQRQSKQHSADPVDALVQARSAGNQSPGHNHQSDHDGHIEIEDILPAKLLHDQCSIERTDNATGLRNRAYDTQRQAASLLAVKITRDGH